MPAKKELLSKYKSYVGRIFSLRKNKIIPVTADNGLRRTVDRETFLGDNIVVVDEMHTRVKVLASNSSFVWIAKYYLHKEIQDSSTKKNDNLTSVVVKLTNEASKDENSGISSLMLEAAEIIRYFLDKNQ